jgi:hypothetical protein
MIEFQLHKIYKGSAFAHWIRHAVLLLVLFLSSFHCFLSAHTLNLYGHSVSFQYQQPQINLANPITSPQLHQAIGQVKKSDISALLQQLDSISVNFGMDDIAYILMADKVAKLIYKDYFESLVFKYALLQEKGYRVMLGFAPDFITVYGHLDFKVHNVAFVEYEDFTYTDISFQQNLETCQETLLELPLEGRAITMNESRPPFFNAQTEVYKIHFEYEGMSYDFAGHLNQSLVNYYRELPAIEFGQVYLNYQLSDPAKFSLVASLKESTYNMFPSKQIDFLLQFAQNAFAYKKDAEWMGLEKFAFPEEVLANPFADCEDKSVLFAYLAKEVLDLPSVALIYYVDNHLNVGVAFNHKSAYNFIYNNQKYLICEPSGLGFKPGDNVYDVKKASIVKW